MTSSVRTIDREFHKQLFRCQDFFSATCTDGNWTIFYVVTDNEGQLPAANCYHGLAVSQVPEILESGVWKAGLWNGSSRTSPLGVWVATSPSVAMDRAALNRGYAARLSPRGVPDAWNVAAVFGFLIEKSEWRQHKLLKNGVHLGRITTHGRVQVPLKELPITQLLIYRPTYEKYNKLPFLWNALQRGECVLCRTRERCPEDLWKGGHGAPLSCGRTSRFPHLDGWHMTTKDGTLQWRCPSCEGNARRKLGSVTGELWAPRSSGWTSLFADL